MILEHRCLNTLQNILCEAIMFDIFSHLEKNENLLIIKMLYEEMNYFKI